MTTTDTEKAQLALDVFAHFETEPGEWLAAGNLLAIAAMNGWDTKQVLASYEHGRSLGWFEDGPDGTVTITLAGRERIRG
ncbi:MAG: hypothetical protein ACK4VM_05480 [Bosea sp. (in: a-proteobacteria)]